MSVRSDSPPPTHDAIRELSKLPALDDLDVDLLRSGDLGWLNDIGSVWSSVHHGRMSCSMSMSSVTGSLDLSAVDVTVDQLAEIEMGRPKGAEELLPVEVLPQAEPLCAVEEVSATPLTSPTPLSTRVDFKAIEESLAAEASARMSLQRQLLELEEERYRVEIIQEELLQTVKPPLPPAPAAQQSPRTRSPPELPVAEYTRASYPSNPVPKPTSEYLSPLQAALREMSDCVSLLAASSGVTHYHTEEPPVHRPPPPMSCAPDLPRRRVLVLPSSVPSRPPPVQHVPVYVHQPPHTPQPQPQLHLQLQTQPPQPLQPTRSFDAHPDYTRAAQPEHCSSIQKQVQGCHVNQVIVTTKYDDGVEQPVEHSRVSDVAPPCRPKQSARPVLTLPEAPEDPLPKKVLAEQTTQTSRVLVAEPAVEVLQVAARNDEPEQDARHSAGSTRGRSNATREASHHEPLRNMSKESKSSKGSGRSRGSSRDSEKVRLRGAPRCADAPTRSSLAKMHRHVEEWPPVEGDNRPPFRPSSISPKRKKLKDTLRHRHRVPYKMAVSTLTAPTESSLSRMRTASQPPHPEDPVPHNVAMFNRHARQAHRGLLRLGPGLTA